MTVATNSSPTNANVPASAAVTNKDVSKEKNYWNGFYSKFNVTHPSQFCVMTAVEVKPEKSIVEFGCGNGRDSVYFASKGFTVFACDLSKDAIAKNEETAAAMKGANLNFEVVDASNKDQVGAVIEKAREAAESDSITAYSRFFLHSIDESQEDLFIEGLASAMKDGDELCFEYRCALDEALDKVHGKGHYRRYIDTDALLEKMAKLGFESVYSITGRGMAKYKSEDPYVSRIICKKI